VTNIPAPGVPQANGGGKDGHRINDIGGTPRSTRSAAGSTRRAASPLRPQGTSSAAAPTAPPTSSLHVSAHGERFVSLRARLEGLEPARADRVERLRQLVASGQYRPDSEAIAKAMLADPATAAALGLRGLGSSSPGAP